jgi:hypothetical protein
MVATQSDSDYAFTGTAVEADQAERARLVAATTTRSVEPTSAADTV